MVEPKRSSKALSMFDKPETWLTIHGFLVAFAWEMFQMPFYAMDQMSTWQVTKSCGIASFGDAGIMVFAYWVASKSDAGQMWLQDMRARPSIIYLLTGLAITVAVEHLALRSDWGWGYSEIMPTLFGVGLVPIMMWVVVPLITLLITRRSLIEGPSN